MNIYYLGLKDRTVQNTNYFHDKILIKPSSDSQIPSCEEIAGHEIDYNLMSNFKYICNYYDKMIDQVVKSDPWAKFMPYNQGTIEFMKNSDRVICVNNVDLIKDLNNKKRSRELLKGITDCLEYKYLKGKEISYKKLKELFRVDNEKFVVQTFVGFAGIGTYVLTKENEQEIITDIKKDKIYSVSIYKKNNLSLNNTFMIGEDEIVIFDGSIQNIVLESELLYNGWDFEKYQNLDIHTKKTIYNQTLKIAEKLKSLGYRGIGGVDYILADNKLYFMEINPRFQASSEELDKILQEEGYESIFQLQYECFYEKNKFHSFCEKYNKRLK